MSGWGLKFFDYDNDGKLDLFLCSFVQYGKGTHVDCGTNKSGKRYYCIPRVFRPTPSKLFHNNGDGTFKLVSVGTEIEQALGKALGVVATDINGDGLMDLFVANDTVQNFLFANRGGGKWEDIGLFAGVAFSADGLPRSGMGVDAADFDGDGLQDLFVANVDQEMYSLYRNVGDETFRDDAHVHGISQTTRLMSGWGLKFFDYDNDGYLDLLLANGHPDDMIGEHSAQVSYAEPLLLFHQEKGTLRDVSKDAGQVFQQSFPARGLALGDFNNDGAVDVLISNNGREPLLLQNRAAAGRHWIGLKLQGVNCNRDAVGARIRWSVGGRKFQRLKNGGGSYLSSHDPRLVLGLGAVTSADWVEVEWPQPSGRKQRFTNVPVDRYLTLVEGSQLEG
jgi:hypothetical protein